MNSPGSKPELIMREIEPDDAEAVSALIRELGYERSPQQVLAWIENRGSCSEQAAFVACLGGEVVGWIEVSIERRLQNAPFALIGGLVVRKGVRGHGVGRKLCHRAEAWSWERSMEKVRVTSRSTRVDAHRFYASDGYETVKTSLVFEKRPPG